jgi:hypothetical protein
MQANNYSYNLKTLECTQISHGNKFRDLGMRVEAMRGMILP